MGTHPIFESDFDCLTGRRLFSCSSSLKCVTSLPIFLLNSVEMMLQMPLPSKPSSEALVSMLMKKLNKVISELSGKAIDDVLAEGKEKLASVPSGGGAAPAAGGAAATGGADDAPAAEAKKESSSEDEDEDMGFGLFD